MKDQDPNEEWLWDGGGTPEPEVQRLEGLLRRYGHREDPALERRLATEPMALPAGGPAPWVWGLGSLAAATLLLIGLYGWLSEPLPDRSPVATGPSYRVEGLRGQALAASGERIVTGANQTAVLEIADLGHVTVRPGSRVRIEDAGLTVHGLYLERGEIHAFIVAEPRRFQVGTPSGMTIDLGCEYDLAVDEEGNARIEVTRGLVAFERDGREVILPEGTWCEARVGEGPNLPVRVDAPEWFEKATRYFESASQPELAPPERALLERVVDPDEVEREIASVTIWHLYRFAPSREVWRECFDWLERRYPFPTGHTRQELLERTGAAVEAWYEQVKTPDWLRQ